MIKPPGKRELNKARRRAAIIDIARRSFVENGFAATSMSAIADELGGSKATLWSHYCSKEGLFVAVVETQVAIFSAEIDKILSGRSFSRDALRRFCVRFIELILEPESVGLFRLVLAEGERFPEIAEIFYTRGPMKLRSAVVAFYETRFPPDEALRLAEVTVCALTGFRSDALVRPLRPSRAATEAFVDSLITLLKLPGEESLAAGAVA